MVTMNIRKVRGRAWRFGVAVATTAGMLLGLVALPQTAQAASSISANLTMNVYGDYNDAVITVHLPMSQEDAAGYLYNHARIMIGCWGDDTFSDDWLLSYYRDGDRADAWFPAATNPYVPADNRVYAATDGVRLRGIIRTPHGQVPSSPDYYDPAGVRGFNEDPGYTLDGYDEVYCKATWIDGDNHQLATFTQVAKGWF
jgi:hypothetical protein